MSFSNYVLIFFIFLSISVKGNIVEFSQDFKVVALVNKIDGNQLGNIYLFKGVKKDLGKKDLDSIRFMINQKEHKDLNYFFVMLNRTLDGKESSITIKPLSSEEGKSLEDKIKSWNKLLEFMKK